MHSVRDHCSTPRPYRLHLTPQVYLKVTCALALHWLQLSRAHAEDHADYRYSFYKEEDGRIEVNTHAFLFEKLLLQPLSIKGEFVYDAISGASPTGSPPVGNSHQVPLVPMQDTRYAGNLEVDWHVGIHTLSPQVAYSIENDYESLGLSLNDAIELNQKNTTLRLGAALSLDKNQPTFFPEPKRKDSGDFLVGVSQLLSPRTILTADFTFGIASGYLSDPYKTIRFDGWLPDTFTFAENRPDQRTREVLLLSLTHHVDPLNASAEVSYRFHHDAFEVYSHTAALTWHQRLGRHLILEPTFRFYEQSAAYFYRLSVPGLGPDDGDPARPEYYSADYRLSHLMSFNYGLQASVILVKDSVFLDVGYTRYEMYGLDSFTSSSAYPKANIVSAGIRVWF